ncbi:DUF3021 domain-containing protein [Thalassobacillus hwangdonensis]|uniref:DUF3021 domain-containing protein n=1 Tax=Thalassobacillus hwangdonensis TaxID=546108 RepID=A0ABW3KY65_9BACI
MKRFLKSSIFGIFFGGFIAVVIQSSFVLAGEEMIDGVLFIKNSLASIFLGWLFSVTPLFFRIRSLNLPVQTLLHFLTVTVIYLLLALGVGWVPFDLSSLLFALIGMILIYTISWIGFYLYFKNEAKRLNDQLNHIR